MKIADLTKQAFAKGGPVTVIAGGYRPEQERFAVWFAETLDRPEADRPELSLAEVDPGAGKTLAYLVPMMLGAVLNNQRGLVSTFTKNLRDQILETDAKKADQVVKMVLKSNGLEYRSTSIEARRSLSGVASLVLADIVLQDAVGSERIEAQAYYDFVEGAFREGKLPQISDWLERGNMFPGGLSNYALTVHERLPELRAKLDPKYDIIHPALDAFKQDVLDNFNSQNSADIVVSTHAMFLMNNVMFGTNALYTRQSNYEDQQDKRPFGSVVMDEADMMNGVTMQWNRHSLNVSDLWDRLLTLPSNALVQASKNAVNDYLNLLNKQKYKIESWEDDDTKTRHVDKLTAISDSINSMVYHGVVILEGGTGDGTLTQDEYTELADSLDAETLSWLDRATNTAHALINIINGETRNRAESQINLYTDTKISTSFFNKNGRKQFVVSSDPTEGGYLSNRAWRNTKVHSFMRFLFVSGTMRGEAGDTVFEDFKRRIGINDKYDTVVATRAFPCPSHGSIRRLVLSEIRSIGADNEDWRDHVARDIITATAGGGRTLVLFPSNDLKTMVEDEVRKHVGNRLIVQAVGTKAKAKFAELRAKPDAIWFGHNWHGDNFVDDNGRSLFTRVIIARAPVTPANTNTFAKMPKLSHRWNKQDAANKIKQGIGRAIRNPYDCPEVWILDPRLSVPRIMAREVEQHGLPTKGRDGFNQLEIIPDHLLKNADLDVILKDGSIKTIRSEMVESVLKSAA